MASRSPNSDRFSLFLKISGIYRESTGETGMVIGSVYELRDLSADTVVDGGGGSAMSLFEKTPAAAAIKKPSGLPDPPEGYEFRLLTKPGQEVTVALEYIAGRYYSLPPALATREASDAVIRTMVPEALADGSVDDEMELGDEVRTEDHRRIALAGLVPASRLYMRVRSLLVWSRGRGADGCAWSQCHTWAVSRSKSISAAEKTAQVRSLFPRLFEEPLADSSLSARPTWRRTSGSTSRRR